MTFLWLLADPALECGHVDTAVSHKRVWQHLVLFSSYVVGLMTLGDLAWLCLGSFAKSPNQAKGTWSPGLEFAFPSQLNFSASTDFKPMAAMAASWSCWYISGVVVGTGVLTSISAKRRIQYFLAPRVEEVGAGFLPESQSSAESSSWAGALVLLAWCSCLSLVSIESLWVKEATKCEFGKPPLPMVQWRLATVGSGAGLQLGLCLAPMSPLLALGHFTREDPGLSEVA